MGNTLAPIKSTGLRINDDWIERSVGPGETVFFSLPLPPYKLLGAERSFLVQVEVVSGLLEGVYMAADETFPSSSRRLLQQHRFSVCPNELCDRNFPQGWNSSGGICLSCMQPNSDWTDASAKRSIGGLGRDLRFTQRARAYVYSETRNSAAGAGAGAGAGASRVRCDITDESLKTVTQANCTFTLRGILAPRGARTAVHAALEDLPRNAACSLVTEETLQYVTVAGLELPRGAVDDAEWAALKAGATFRIRVRSARLPQKLHLKAGNAAVLGEAEENPADEPAAVEAEHAREAERQRLTFVAAAQPATAAAAAATAEAPAAEPPVAGAIV